MIGNIVSQLWRYGLLGLCLGLLRSCGLPRSGPTKSEILDSTVTKAGSTYVVNVTRGVARAADFTPALGFSQGFRSAGRVGSDTIRAGDTLSLTIWENVDQGILTIGGVPAPLSAVQVDGKMVDAPVIERARQILADAEDT